MEVVQKLLVAHRHTAYMLVDEENMPVRAVGMRDIIALFGRVGICRQPRRRRRGGGGGEKSRRKKW